MDNDTCEDIKPADMGWILVRNTSRDRPRVARFFLANTACADIMVEASAFMSDFEIALNLEDRNAVIGQEQPIKGLPFISTRYMAKLDPRWDTIRTNILRKIADYD